MPSVSRPKPGPLGLQPLVEVLKQERWTYAAAAREVGVSYAHLYNVAIGRTAPSPMLREGLPRLLRTSQRRLFTSEALRATFQPHKSRVAARVRQP